MPLENWQLIHQPCDRDKNRWQLKLKISNRDVMALVNTLPGIVGRPSALEEDDFSFELFLYEIRDKEFAVLTEILSEKYPDGKIVGPNKETTLDSMLEKISKNINDITVKASAKKSASEKVEGKPKVKETAEKGDAPAKEPEPKEEKKSEVSGQDAAAEETKNINQTNVEVQAEQTTEKSIPQAPGHVPAPDAFQPSKYKTDEIDLNPKYVFSEFVIGPNNRFTAAAAQAVADNSGKIYNPFFIYGGVGLGKTHLMHAVGHYVRSKNKDMKVLCVTTEKFMSEVIESIRKGTLLQMREYYRQVDLLLVDDIQFLVESESTQEEFFHTFNVLHQNGRQIIITSDRPPKQLTTLEDRLRSRFEWGLIADIKSPNLETRVAILKKKEESERLNLDDNILLYIASKLKSNIRELEGFLRRINAYATLTHQDVNIELVKSLMNELLPEEEVEEVKVPPKPKPKPKLPEEEPVIKVVPSKPEPEAVEPVSRPEPVSKPPVVSKPVVPVPPPIIVTNTDDGVDSRLKPVEVSFFFPEGSEEYLGKVKEKFKDVIKKHKLKFRLDGAFERAYSYKSKINYAFFSELCKTNSLKIAIVLGPPEDSNIASEDFGNLLGAVMDDDGISLQLVPWEEKEKDYRYLNLALDITLLRHKT